MSGYDFKIQRMNKQIVAIALIALVVILASTAGCKKAVTGTPMAASHLVKSMTTNLNGTLSSASYTYNSQGKVVSVQYSSTFHYSVSYGADTINYLFYDSAATSPSGSVTYTLNSAGYAITDNQGDIFSYDANGEKTWSREPGYDSASWTWSNGNTIVQNDTMYGVITQYINSYLTTLNTLNFGEPFLGKYVKNLVNTQTVISAGSSQTFTYSYQFDSEGRVTQLTKSGNGYLELDTYTY
jgi:hypothetical protein